MNIEYNILWLDDQINEFVEGEWVNKIENYLENEGFIPKIITTSKYDEFTQKLDDSFDLILTDFHMTSKNGNEVVNEIREKSILTEILFYTAQGDLTEIGKIDRVSFVETNGNHHEQVIQETIKLIGLTIKKFQHIVSMRGMIMHETSTLDNSTADILAKYIDSGKANYDQITDSICEKMSTQLQKKQEIVKKVKQNHNLKKLMKDNFLFSADYKIDALKKILSDLGEFVLRSLFSPSLSGENSVTYIVQVIIEPFLSGEPVKLHPAPVSRGEEDRRPYHRAMTDKVHHHGFFLRRPSLFPSRKPD
jgi:CheY-like chemotaxis protein